MLINKQKYKILLIDDDEGNHDLVEQLLRNEALELLHAYTAEEGLEQYNSVENIAVVVVDVQLPDMDGFAFAKRIYSDPKNEDVPLLFISAHRKQEQDLFKGYTLGAFDYIKRPFSPRILIQKIRMFAELYLNKKALENKNRELKKLNAEVVATKDRFVEMLSNRAADKSLELGTRSSLFALNERLLNENRQLKETLQEYKRAMDKMAGYVDGVHVSTEAKSSE